LTWSLREKQKIEKTSICQYGAGVQNSGKGNLLPEAVRPVGAGRRKSSGENEARVVFRRPNGVWLRERLNSEISSLLKFKWKK